jgi:hypothetical protein
VANAIHALARKRQTQGTEPNALARMRAGRARDGDDLGLPIHWATLQQAVALLELAGAIRPHPCRTWTRVGPLLRLGHDTVAAAVYGSAGGDYARHAPVMVAQCQATVTGTHDSVAEHARHFVAQVARCEANGVESALLIAVESRFGELLEQAAQQSQPAPKAAGGLEPPVGNPQLDRAAQAAQVFAELLADENCEEAQ